jgi:predicted hotdog family 3-hydroxylacyl-ACP dehydratase
LPASIDVFVFMRSLIPHTGTMCLLDRVETFDDKRIVCRATSHRRLDNPLRHHDQLSVQAGIEYAAQAVAAHGSLLARQNGGDPSPPCGGMIAVLTNVSWQVDRLDNIAADLTVAAEKLADLPQGLNYRFTLSANCVSVDQRPLLEGELIIALQSMDA